MKYNCAITADCVIFSGNSLLLIKRKNPPFKDQFALPGGFIEDNETAEAACARELKEETNIDLKESILIGVYSEPNRDPRGRVVSFAFLGQADLSNLKAGDDAKECKLVENWQSLDLAFDHKKIVLEALKLK